MMPLSTKLSDFWKVQGDLIRKLTLSDREEFKNHTDLPLARIKRIMKADDDVRMIRAEAPVLFAKACELFILEMTMRYVRLRVYDFEIFFPLFVDNLTRFRCSQGLQYRRRRRSKESLQGRHFRNGS